MTTKLWLLPAVLAGSTLAASAALAQAPGPATSPGKLANGAQVFDTRCKTCHEPPVGRAPGKAELATRPQKLALAPIGGQSSVAGDLVWTYGSAKWSEAGVDRHGQYVRIWQRRPEGWRMVFDEFVPVPPPEKS